MDGLPIVADGTAPPRPRMLPPITPPISLVPYNISLNLSSIFAMLPGSRFLARWRKGVFETQIDPSELPAVSIAEQLASAASQPVVETVTPEIVKEQLQAFPGPWGFFTSGYLVGLFIMAILLHRIQNVIIPSRIPTRRQRHAFRFAPVFASPFQNTLFLQRLYASILPLDFTRTTTRLILHLPSVYFLTKMLLVWCILVLETSELLPQFTEEQKNGYWGALCWIENLFQWGTQMNMTEICWSTFVAVCGAFLVEGFVKAMDGLGGGFPLGNVNTSTSPFNLVGYAFLLHIYSSPVTHSYQPNDGLPSRPDKHVIITITIPLLQLTLFHILSVSKRLSTHRLLPTALTSMLSLAHFHGTLFAHFSQTHSQAEPTTTSSAPKGPRRPTPYLGAPNANYPLLNYIPNIFETFLISTILLTIFINALVQLLVRGRVDRVLSGLGIGPGANIHNDDETPTSFLQSLPYEEDFGVLLLRVGTASLEATGLRGWGNEVAPIQLPAQPRRRRSTTLIDTHSFDTSPTYGRVRMGRLGVGDVSYGASTSASTSRMLGGSPDVFSDTTSRSRRPRGPPASTTTAQVRGFNNDVRTVDLGNSDAANGGGLGNGTNGSWRRWFGEMGGFIRAMWGVLRGLVVFLLERARGRVRVREQAAARKPIRAGVSAQGATAARDAEVEDAEDEERRREKEIYQRFLRGEDISDDEDYHSGQTELEESDSEEESESTHDGEEGSDEREAETVQLFTDFIRSGGSREAGWSSSNGGEMVLAHLMHGASASGASPGPLTRRRWDALVQRSPHDLQRRGQRRDDFDDLNDDNSWDPARRARTIFDQYVDDASQRERQQGYQHLCVICTTETREIICWPCRCLSMCDNCREALASRSAPTKHRCPCCRQTVEGYSRIYIP
ncbi:unnamed protein product [Cyclocybe aegerita]|uniref:RING-type domain-containing protein n=1 Tax=Cyclocybe aegerita TaxID=1973307 RepID=A0A8S0WTK1_CYCAE|nr:unnamed protein product [Cyclocybe aegerita]